MREKVSRFSSCAFDDPVVLSASEDWDEFPVGAMLYPSQEKIITSKSLNCTPGGWTILTVAVFRSTQPLDGVLLGLKDGSTDGEELGLKLGLVDGIELGCKEGWLVGCPLGSELGLVDGFELG